MFYIVSPEGHRCGPLDTHAAAHMKGTMWYGTGNFEVIEEKPKATKGTAKATPKTEKPAPLEGSEDSQE